MLLETAGWSGWQKSLSHLQASSSYACVCQPVKFVARGEELCMQCGSKHYESACPAQMVCSVHKWLYWRQLCCQPQEVCGSGVANVWNVSQCCTVPGHWADLHTVVQHLWMAWYKRSDMWPCCRLLQEQTCSLWCDAKDCHHGFISRRHWHIELGLTYLQWMLHREMFVTSLWWGAVIRFINFQISCYMKSNLDCRSRKTWMCRSNIVMNSAVPEGLINQMGSSQVNWWHQMELYSVLPSAMYFQSGM